MAEIQQILKSLAATSVTKTIHVEPYAALSLSKPELSQAGRVVLVTGGGTGVGNSIARSFVKASADTVIIIGRRSDVLATAASGLEELVKTTGSTTKIIAATCDVVDIAQVDALWKDLATQGITVDVFVANVAKFTEPKPILELGTAEVWSQLEANVKAPLYFAEKFCAQPGDKQRVSSLFPNSCS